MTFGIIATPGAADANSYVTEAEATNYIAEMILNSDVQHWGTGNEDSRHRALAAATQRLDRERYLGARATDTQALQWPRTGVRKPDTYINTYSVGFPFRITTDYFADTEVPEYIKRAQVELAVYLHQNVEGLGLSGLEDYKSVSIGSISVTPNQFGATGADRIPPMVERYLIGLRISGPGNIAIKRS